MKAEKLTQAQREAICKARENYDILFTAGLHDRTFRGIIRRGLIEPDGDFYGLRGAWGYPLSELGRTINLDADKEKNG